jgi:hypothetical protein
MTGIMQTGGRCCCQSMRGASRVRTRWRSFPSSNRTLSMKGDKLHYAKLSVLKLVDHLAPGDFCGVVTFTDEVATIAPPLEMTQPRKDALKAAVGQLGPQGSTNFAGGLLTGLELANKVKLPAGMQQVAHTALSTLTERPERFDDGLAQLGRGPGLEPREPGERGSGVPPRSCGPARASTCWGAVNSWPERAEAATIKRQQPSRSARRTEAAHEADPAML